MISEPLNRFVNGIHNMQSGVTINFNVKQLWELMWQGGIDNALLPAWWNTSVGRGYKLPANSDHEWCWLVVYTLIAFNSCRWSRRISGMTSSLWCNLVSQEEDRNQPHTTQQCHHHGGVQFQHQLNLSHRNLHDNQWSHSLWLQWRRQLRPHQEEGNRCFCRPTTQDIDVKCVKS